MRMNVDVATQYRLLNRDVLASDMAPEQKQIGKEARSSSHGELETRR